MVLKEHVDAHMDVLDPIDPAAFGSVGELRDAARERIAVALAARDEDHG